MFENKILSKIITKQPCQLSDLLASDQQLKKINIIQTNYDAFIYRDSYTRRKYNFRNLKNVKNTSDSNEKFFDQKLYILNNIKKYRNSEIIKQKKIKQFQDTNDGLLKETRKKLISNNDTLTTQFLTTKKYFGQYLKDQNKKSPFKEEFKNVEENQQRDLNRFKSSKMIQHPSLKQSMYRIKILKEFQSEFQTKFKKQYKQLQIDLINKIKNKNRYIVQPEEQSYKSVSPSLKYHEHNIIDLEFQNKLFQETRNFIKNQIKFTMENQIEKTLQNFKENAVSTEPLPTIHKKFYQMIKKCNLFDINYILQQNPDLINCTDQKGNSPLHIAVKTGNLQVCSILLKKGASCNIKNKFGKTEYDIAKHFDNEDIIKLIKKKIQENQLI